MKDIERIYTHAHLFCGIGAGAKGFNQAQPRIGHLTGKFRCLGGIDVDYVIRSAPDAVYRRSREMLERAAKVGAYALGTGNSVPEYVPVENYCAMIWAAVETR